MSDNVRRIAVTELNPYLICILCGGYYVDATSIIECLHTFCKSCIVRYLEESKFCPVCDVLVHKTDPLLSIRPDKRLQTIVYKLIPGLHKGELSRRKEFYQKNLNGLPTSKVDDSQGCDLSKKDSSPEERISLVLEPISSNVEDQVPRCIEFRRYFSCPVQASLAHLKKLLRAKFELPLAHPILFSAFRTDVLSNDLTLADVGRMKSWKMLSPLLIYYKIYFTKRIKLEPSLLEKPIKIERSPSPCEELPILEPKVEEESSSDSEEKSLSMFPSICDPPYLVPKDSSLPLPVVPVKHEAKTLSCSFKSSSTTVFKTIVPAPAKPLPTPSILNFGNNSFSLPTLTPVVESLEANNCSLNYGISIVQTASANISGLLMGNILDVPNVGTSLFPYGFSPSFLCNPGVNNFIPSPIEHQNAGVVLQSLTNDKVELLVTNPIATRESSMLIPVSNMEPVTVVSANHTQCNPSPAQSDVKTVTSNPTKRKPKKTKPLKHNKRSKDENQEKEVQLNINESGEMIINEGKSPLEHLNKMVPPVNSYADHLLKEMEHNETLLVNHSEESRDSEFSDGAEKLDKIKREISTILSTLSQETNSVTIITRDDCSNSESPIHVIPTTEFMAGRISGDFMNATVDGSFPIVTEIVKDVNENTKVMPQQSDIFEKFVSKELLTESMQIETDKTKEVSHFEPETKRNLDLDDIKGSVSSCSLSSKNLQSGESRKCRNAVNDGNTGIVQETRSSDKNVGPTSTISSADVIASSSSNIVVYTSTNTSPSNILPENICLAKNLGTAQTNISSTEVVSTSPKIDISTSTNTTPTKLITSSSNHAMASLLETKLNKADIDKNIVQDHIIGVKNVGTATTSSTSNNLLSSTSTCTSRPQIDTKSKIKSDFNKNIVRERISSVKNVAPTPSISLTEVVPISSKSAVSPSNTEQSNLISTSSRTPTCSLPDTKSVSDFVRKSSSKATKSPSQSIRYKTLKTAPKAWNPTISRDKLKSKFNFLSPKTNKFFKARNSSNKEDSDLVTIAADIPTLKFCSSKLQDQSSPSKRKLFEDVKNKADNLADQNEFSKRSASPSKESVVPRASIGGLRKVSVRTLTEKKNRIAVEKTIQRESCNKVLDCFKDATKEVKDLPNHSPKDKEKYVDCKDKANSNFDSLKSSSLSKESKVTGNISLNQNDSMESSNSNKNYELNHKTKIKDQQSDAVDPPNIITSRASTLKTNKELGSEIDTQKILGNMQSSSSCKVMDPSTVLKGICASLQSSDGQLNHRVRNAPSRNPLETSISNSYALSSDLEKEIPQPSSPLPLLQSHSRRHAKTNKVKSSPLSENVDASNTKVLNKDKCHLPDTATSTKSSNLSLSSKTPTKLLKVDSSPVNKPKDLQHVSPESSKDSNRKGTAVIPLTLSPILQSNLKISSSEIAPVSTSSAQRDTKDYESAKPNKSPLDTPASKYDDGSKHISHSEMNTAKVAHENMEENVTGTTKVSENIINTSKTVTSTVINEVTEVVKVTDSVKVSKEAAVSKVVTEASLKLPDEAVTKVGGNVATISKKSIETNVLRNKTSNKDSVSHNDGRKSDNTTHLTVVLPDGRESEVKNSNVLSSQSVANTTTCAKSTEDVRATSIDKSLDSARPTSSVPLATSSPNIQSQCDPQKSETVSTKVNSEKVNKTEKAKLDSLNVYSDSIPPNSLAMPVADNHSNKASLNDPSRDGTIEMNVSKLDVSTKSVQNEKNELSKLAQVSECNTVTSFATCSSAGKVSSGNDALQSSISSKVIDTNTQQLSWKNPESSASKSNLCYGENMGLVSSNNVTPNQYPLTSNSVSANSSSTPTLQSSVNSNNYFGFQGDGSSQFGTFNENYSSFFNAFIPTSHVSSNSVDTVTSSKSSSVNTSTQDQSKSTVFSETSKPNVKVSEVASVSSSESQFNSTNSLSSLNSISAFPDTSKLIQNLFGFSSLMYPDSESQKAMLKGSDEDLDNLLLQSLSTSIGSKLGDVFTARPSESNTSEKDKVDSGVSCTQAEPSKKSLEKSVSSCTTTSNFVTNSTVSKTPCTSSSKTAVYTNPSTVSSFVTNTKVTPAVSTTSVMPYQQSITSTNYNSSYMEALKYAAHSSAPTNTAQSNVSLYNYNMPYQNQQYKPSSSVSPMNMTTSSSKSQVVHNNQLTPSGSQSNLISTETKNDKHTASVPATTYSSCLEKSNTQTSVALTNNSNDALQKKSSQRPSYTGSYPSSQSSQLSSLALNSMLNSYHGTDSAYGSSQFPSYKYGQSSSWDMNALNPFFFNNSEAYNSCSMMANKGSFFPNANNNFQQNLLKNSNAYGNKDFSENAHSNVNFNASTNLGFSTKHSSSAGTNNQYNSDVSNKKSSNTDSYNNSNQRYNSMHASFYYSNYNNNYANFLSNSQNQGHSLSSLVSGAGYNFPLPSSKYTNSQQQFLNLGQNTPGNSYLNSGSFNSAYDNCSNNPTTNSSATSMGSNLSGSLCNISLPYYSNCSFSYNSYPYFYQGSDMSLLSPGASFMPPFTCLPSRSPLTGRSSASQSINDFPLQSGFFPMMPFVSPLQGNGHKASPTTVGAGIPPTLGGKPFSPNYPHKINDFGKSPQKSQQQSPKSGQTGKSKSKKPTNPRSKSSSGVKPP